MLVHFEPKTKSVRRAFVFLTSTAVLLIPSLIGAEVLDVHALARAVDEHYNRLRTLQAEFTEIYRGSGIERTESGTLWLKKPGKMRWEYRSPREKLFLSDGKDAWFYLPGDRQVRKTPVRKLDDLRSPLGFLLGKTRLEKELHGLSAAPDVAPLNEGDMVLRGVPKTMADRINQVLLEITPAGKRGGGGSTLPLCASTGHGNGRGRFWTVVKLPLFVLFAIVSEFVTFGY